MAPTFNMTILYNDGTYKLMPGLPSERGLNPTAAHTFPLGSEEAVFWAVGCDLSGEEIKALARRLLAK